MAVAKNQLRQVETIEIPHTPVGTHTQLADISTATVITKPEGARRIRMQADGSGVRYTLDGQTAPTSSLGFHLDQGQSIELFVSGDDIRVIEESVSGSLDYQWLE